MNVNSGFSLFPEIYKIITLKISFTLLSSSYEVLYVEDARIWAAFIFFGAKTFSWFQKVSSLNILQINLLKNEILIILINIQ